MALPVPRVSRLHGAIPWLSAGCLVVATLSLFHDTRHDSATSPAAPVPVVVVFEDQDGCPRVDVFVVRPDGRDLVPDGRGILDLSARDGGRTFQVVEKLTRRRLREFTLPIRSSGVVSIEVPR